MDKKNRWIHGKRNFVGPPLPKSLRGSIGCSFQEAIFDPNVGPEIFLTILEEEDYCETLGSLNSINLFCKTGVGRTTHGIVAFLIFSVYNKSEHVSDYELFMNPHKMKTINLLSSLGQQSNLKVVIYESGRGLLCGLFELKNVFGIKEFVGTLAQVIGNEAQGDFSEAIEEFTNKYTLDDLLKL